MQNLIPRIPWLTWTCRLTEIGLKKNMSKVKIFLQSELIVNVLLSWSVMSYDLHLQLDLPELDNEKSEAVRNFIGHLMDSRPGGATFRVIRYGNFYITQQDLLQLDNEKSEAVRNFIGHLMDSRPGGATFMVIRNGNFYITQQDLLQLDNEKSEAVRNFIGHLMDSRPGGATFMVIRNGNFYITQQDLLQLDNDNLKAVRNFIVHLMDSRPGGATFRVIRYSVFSWIVHSPYVMSEQRWYSDLALCFQGLGLNQGLTFISEMDDYCSKVTIWMQKCKSHINPHSLCPLYWSPALSLPVTGSIQDSWSGGHQFKPYYRWTIIGCTFRY